jgi:hypothetical protein
MDNSVIISDLQISQFFAMSVARDRKGTILPDVRQIRFYEAHTVLESNGERTKDLLYIYTISFK